MCLKILIVGYGSIGKRHTDNLLNIGKLEIIVYSKNKESFKLVKKGVKICTSFEDALKEKPDISIICNETSFHVDTAIKLAKINSHLFIEKPLSHSLVNLTKLLKIVKRKKLMKYIKIDKQKFFINDLENYCCFWIYNKDIFKNFIITSFTVC